MKSYFVSQSNRIEDTIIKIADLLFARKIKHDKTGSSDKTVAATIEPRLRLSEKANEVESQHDYSPEHKLWSYKMPINDVFEKWSRKNESRCSEWIQEHVL